MSEAVDEPTGMGAAATSPGARATPNLIRRTAWAGVTAREPVAVVGTRLRNATWTFLAHVRNETTGAEWVECVGGRHGDRALRSFRPEQVFPVRGRPVRSRRTGEGGHPGGGFPSLAVAPQLPLVAGYD